MTQLSISPGQPFTLFTDLDGTLIDHHTYSAGDARQALRQLAECGIPVIFCSSKTFAEQVFLQRQLGLRQPFIVENGSAVVVPKGYFSAPPPNGRGDAEFITRPSHSGEGLNEESGYDIFPLAHTNAAAIRTELAYFQDIRGFAAASDAELSEATGLTGEALQRARDRHFTETLLTPLDAEQVVFLKKNLAEKRLALSRGGRFYTVQSTETDKGKAVRWLTDVFRKNLPIAPLIAAIGDSPNDAPMLAAADFPFLVQKHDGTWADVEVPGLIKIEGVGPAGFSAAVRMLLGG